MSNLPQLFVPLLIIHIFKNMDEKLVDKEYLLEKLPVLARQFLKQIFFID